jgi:hypothetical protein
MTFVLIIICHHWPLPLQIQSSSPTVSPFFSVLWNGDVHELHQWVHLTCSFCLGSDNKESQKKVKWWEKTWMIFYTLQGHYRIAGSQLLSGDPLHTALSASGFWNLLH